jgi:TRAP-type transport system small permease protein
LNTVLDRYCRLLEALSAILLALMVVLVFGNVVLRYGFNSGITLAEEVSQQATHRQASGPRWS